jgi:hypothetical protein
MRIRAVTLLTSLVTVGALVVGGSFAESAGAKSAKAAPCAGGTKAAAIKQIKLAYDFFLDGLVKPPRTADQRKAYVQGLSDPATAALFDKTQAANAASAATTTIKISAVKCTGKSKAEITGDLVVGGQTLKGIFPNPGLALIDGGTWKVAKQTFCDLTALADSTVTQAGQPCAP